MLLPSHNVKMPEVKPVASTSAALDPHKPSPTPFGATTLLPCASEDEDEIANEADEDGGAGASRRKDKGKEERPKAVPIPDQRLENNFLTSIRNYISFPEAGDGETILDRQRRVEIDMTAMHDRGEAEFIERDTNSVEQGFDRRAR